MTTTNTPRPFRPATHRLGALAAALALAAGAPGAWAQAGAAGQAEAGQAGQAGQTGQTSQGGQSAESAPAPAPAPAASESIFSSTVSPTQLSFTPSYENTSRSKAPGTMTAPVHGASYGTGGVFLYPAATASFGHNDNLIGSPDHELVTRFMSLSPELVAEIKHQGDRYTASYIGNYTRYASSTDDNYKHHEFEVAGDNTFSSRAHLSWLLGYAERSDPRGSNDRSVGSVPDKWHAPTAALRFSYGSEGAIGRVELESALQNKRYDNNRATTVAADVNVVDTAARFYYRVAPRTRLLVEARRIGSDYQFDASNNDNSDTRLLIGATWEASAATTGTVKIGGLKKRFDNGVRADYSGLSWEANLRWSPRTYSVLDLTSSKGPTDATGVGDYILTNYNTLLWTHDWNEKFATRLNLGLTNSDYHGTIRKDDIKNAGISVSYALQRWLHLNGDLTRTQRTSTQAGLDLTRNVLSLSLEGTL
ncbi:MAG: outer membrane beta-barrel protein [Pseudomonadota bacterium]